MSNRVSQTILLCEDEEQERLAKAYLKLCGRKTQEPYVKALVASRMQYGGNVGWVLNEFPRQLHACRQRQKRAETLLIVLVDADNFTVEARRRELLDRLNSTGAEPFGQKEPAVLLIPKRHVETWIRALLGETVTEDQNCKTRNKPSKADIRRAAQTLCDWSRAGATPGASCVPSLEAALPQWNEIG